MFLFARPSLPILCAMLTLTATLLEPVAWADPGDYQPYSAAASGGQVSAPLFVVLAYSAIWLVLLGFVATVWLRQRRLEAELPELRRTLERR